MIIGNPKIRKKMNNTVDNIVFALFFPIFIICIYGGAIYGMVERKLSK